MHKIDEHPHEPAYKRRRNAVPYLVTIPRDLAAQADAVAAEETCSRSRLIQTALREMIDRRQQQKASV